MDINNKILDFLYTTVSSEGGDGWGIWLCKYTNIDNIYPLIEAYNLENNLHWTVEKDEKSLSWGEGEEFVTITNDEELFEQAHKGCYEIKLIY